jgi:hypothetical protein
MLTGVSRILVDINAELDERLAAEAAKENVSKSTLVRRLIEEKLGVAAKPDPLDDIVGMIDDEPGPIDETVYSPDGHAEAKKWLAEFQDIGRRIYENSKDPRSMVEILQQDRR